MAATVGIIGTGWVGASTAISLLQSGIAGTLLLYDIDDDVAEGEAIDLAHGAAFLQPATVLTAAVEDMLDADVVVVSAGRGGRPGETRLDLLQGNASIIREIGSKLVGYKGIIIVVTNPVDVLTHLMVKSTGLPLERVLGTGTMLETARLRQIVGREVRLDPRSVHAQVVGEHGDSNVVLWSGARIGGVPLRQWEGWELGRERVLAEEVRTAAYEIIRRKGATNHAIGLVTAALIRWILGGGRRVLTLSRVQDGALGLSDVALSLPTIVGRAGGTQVIEPEMDEKEREAVRRSAGVLRAAVADVP